MSSTASETPRRSASPVERGQDQVLAVLVTSGERPHLLGRVLTALEDGARRPDRLVVVATGAEPEPVQAAVAGWSVPDVPAEVVTAPGLAFGAAVAAGVAAAAAEPVIDLRDAAPAGPGWLWVLHDDSAPAPDALVQLLARSRELTGATVIGPKQRSWRRRHVLVECGVALARSGRPERGVVPGDVDQGQTDGRSDVMAVGSAGLLVRRDVWDRLGGFSRAFPADGAAHDLCWRARRAGERVVVAPGAIVYHRHTNGLDHHRSRAVQRRTAGTTALVHAPAWRVPFVAVRVLLGGILRFLAGLVTLAPRRAWDDLTGSVAAVGSVRRVASGRRAGAATATVPRRDLRHLRPSVGQRVVHLSESLASRRPDDGPETGTRRHPVAALLKAVAGVAIVLLLVCLTAGWGLWFGDGRLTGGALLPAPDGALDLLATFGSPWHEVGLGSDVAAPPYLLVVGAVAALLLGSATTAVQILLLAAPVLAAAALMICLRGLVRPAVAVVAALAYGLLPALTTAVDTGRLGTAVAAVLLPFTGRLLGRIVGPLPGLPRATGRTVAAAAVVVAALGAFVPVLGIASVAAAAGAAALTRRPRALTRVLVVAAAAAALLWPWTALQWSQPGRLLLEVGAQPARLTADAADVWQLALLNPGGLGAPPALLAAGLMALAVLALVPARTRGAAVAGWWVVLAGLLVALLQALVPVSVDWSAVPLRAWPGAGTLVMGLGAVLAIVAALSGFALDRVLSRTALVAVAVTPLLVGGWWIAESDSLLRRTEPEVISPFVTVASLGPDAPRSLVLEQRPGGTVAYRLLSGAGPRLGDADVAPPLETLASFDSAVSRVASGSADAVAELAEASVRFLSVDVVSDRDLARQLDAVTGLRRISTIDGQGLWEVDRPLPRVRALTPDGPVALAADSVGPSVTAAGPLPAGTTSVELAERPADVWQAEASGTVLTAQPAQWQVFGVPPGVTGETSIGVDTTSRALTLVAPALAALALLIAAMRARRPRPAAPRASGREPAPDVVDLRDKEPVR